MTDPTPAGRPDSEPRSTQGRSRLQVALDRLIGLAIAATLLGSALGFGGAAWWGPAFLAASTGLTVLATVSRAMVAPRWTFRKSPLAALGLLAVGLGVFQSIPLPADLVRSISPRAHEVWSLGAIGSIARADDPDAALVASGPSRMTLTVDRSATLRWIPGAVGALGLFWATSRYVDRLGRTYLVWGAIVAAAWLNSSILAVGLLGRAEGFLGFIDPGAGPKWGPSGLDMVEAPGTTTLRPLAATGPDGHAWALPVAGPTPRLGTMLGGPGSTLAIGALGLPLALAILLQVMAPRGSREGLWVRLGSTGQGSLLAMLYASTLLGAFVIGLLAGPGLAIPYAAGAILIGLPGVWRAGLGGKGYALVALTLAAIGGGVVLGEVGAGLPPGVESPGRVRLDRSREIWSDALSIRRDFPVVGSGLGTFATVSDSYKDRDASSTTAMSSLLQWAAESGMVGLGILTLAILWGLVRLPGAIRRVGSADRPLAAGAVVTLACFGGVSLVLGTVELPAVSLAAAAVAGTCDRWLAGGTDLFVERT